MNGFSIKKKLTKVMLPPANKIIILLTLLLVFSCKNEATKIKEQRKLLYQYSRTFIGEKEYFTIYKLITDTITSRIDNKLKYYSHLGKTKKYQVDSLLCFNHSKSMLFFIILQQQLLETGVQDDIQYMYGTKIKNQWYFFDGRGVLCLPREYYQKNIHVPLSFEKMKQIAIKESFYGYLKKGENGALEINDNFFNDFTSEAWCTGCNTQAEWDSVYLRQVRLNWVKRDYTEYDVK